MSPAQLLSHFDSISEAPDAIPRLRRFILDLAVRGKLVEQDPKDEPASELLKRIQVERERHSADGAIRKNKADSQIDVDEKPFELPKSWVPSSLGEVARYGLPEKVDSNKAISANTWVLDLEDIEKDSSRLVERILSSSRPFQSSKTRFKKGDVLFGKLRPYLNKVLVADADGVCTTEIVPIRGFCEMAPEYIRLVLKSPLTMKRVDRLMYGMKMPRLGTDDALALNFPLPPLAEQHRIVAKVDELMALCDRLGAAQAERESRRDRLAASSLQRLNQPAEESSAFREHARFALDNLPRFTTRPEHIQQIRQTILNLAVRGKLVPQDPKDEPAYELLKRLQTEQEELIKARVLKPDGNDSRLLEEDLPCDIPSTWKWVPLRSIIVFGPQNGISPKPSSRPGAPRAITLTATTSGKFNPQHFKRVDATIPPDSEFWLHSDDLLFQRGNTREYVGIAAYYTGEPRLFLYPDLMIKVRLSQKVSLRYVHLWAIAPPARAYFSIHASGAQATMPKINQGTLLQLPVPIPPLAEQRRIVDKVEELMALCDRLEAQLTTTQTECLRLLEAILHDLSYRQSDPVAGREHYGHRARQTEH
jgi:type I restriction enzyme S subunit